MTDLCRQHGARKGILWACPADGGPAHTVPLRLIEPSLANPARMPTSSHATGGYGMHVWTNSGA